MKVKSASVSHSKVARRRKGERDQQQIGHADGSFRITSFSSDSDGEVSSDVELVGEGFFEEEVLNSRADEDWVQREERCHGVVDLVELEGRSKIEGEIREKSER